MLELESNNKIWNSDSKFSLTTDKLKGYPILNSSFFIRQNGNTGILYLKRYNEDFINSVFYLTSGELLFLSLLNGTARLKEILNIWLRKYLDIDYKGYTTSLKIIGDIKSNRYFEIISLQHFVKLAVDKGIIRINSKPIKVDLSSQIDNSIDLTMNYNKVKHIKNFTLRTDQPVYFTFLPTFKCYIECSYCYLGPNKNSIKTSLSYQKIKEILKECSHLSIFQIRLSGGELIKYKYLFKLLPEFKERNIFLGKPISTKIPLSRQMLKRLKEVGIERLQFSLDSTNPNILVSLLDFRTSRQASNYILMMYESMHFASHIGIQIDLRLTLTKESYPYIKNFIDKFSTIDLLKNVILAPVITDNIKVPYYLALTKSDLTIIKTLIQEISIDHSDLKIILKYNYDSLNWAKEENINSLRFSSTTDFIKNCYCLGNRSTFTLLPDGRTSFCAALFDQPQYDLGNLSYQTISEMWSSEKAMLLAEPPKNQMKYSACYSCKDFKRCVNSASKCYLLVANAYGDKKIYNPDPRCPEAWR